MKDWKQILYDIYSPEVGLILAAPNDIWTNLLTSSKSETHCHPLVIGKDSSYMPNCQFVFQQNLLVVVKCFQMVIEIFLHFTHGKQPNHGKEHVFFCKN